MTGATDAFSYPEAPPPVRLLVGELRILRDWLRARIKPTPRTLPKTGAGQSVITIPGFMAGDFAMAQMRADLNAAGYRAYGWAGGMNRGARPDTLDQLGGRVQQVIAETGHAPVLIGWSLGGFYAREFAKYNPDKVAAVMTLGTPFSGSRKANHAWRVYRIFAGHSVENPPIAFHDDPKPPQPTFAFWSGRDGVIAPPCACGRDDERDQAIELTCGHMGMAYDRMTIDAIIAALAEIHPA
jgi:pimeloyl-ACP methyl ester carboxylesterase